MFGWEITIVKDWRYKHFGTHCRLFPALLNSHLFVKKKKKSLKTKTFSSKKFALTAFKLFFDGFYRLKSHLYTVNQSFKANGSLVSAGTSFFRSKLCCFVVVFRIQIATIFTDRNDFHSPRKNSSKIDYTETRWVNDLTTVLNRW